jgi:hypothetical protein
VPINKPQIQKAQVTVIDPANKKAGSKTVTIWGVSPRDVIASLELAHGHSASKSSRRKGNN